MLSQVLPGCTGERTVLNAQVQKRRCAKQKLVPLKSKVHYPSSCLLAVQFPRHLNPAQLSAMSHMAFQGTENKNVCNTWE